ncbi:MAG: SPASM domain-containing protein [Planctomycetes bacterium]|nr:SPASM domain-containing protein [Planctomycetota bacterium]
MNTREPPHFSVEQRCNSELAVRALRLGSGVALHRPTQVYLQLASACGRPCWLCGEHALAPTACHGERSVSLAPEVFARLERDVFPWSSQLFLTVGGEPTFSTHFADFATRAAAAGQEIHLATHGTHLERDAIAEVVARRIAFVRIAIDAATAETYERQRVGASWTRLVAGLEKLGDFRRSAADGHGCRLSLGFAIARGNVHELPAFVELARRIGADAVHARHVVATKGAESSVAEPELYDRAYAEAAARAEELGVEFDAPPRFADEAARLALATRVLDPDLADYAVPCRSPNQMFLVLHDGRVQACRHPLAHDKLEMGDLRTQSFAEIWNGHAYRNLRAGLKTGDAPKLCRACPIVHASPPIAATARELAASPNVRKHYGSRELEPAPEVVGAETLARSGVAEYTHDLRAHADALAAELVALRAHARTIEAERDALAGHTANREWERAHLLRHIANLERERPRLNEHIANLQASEHNLAAHAGRIARKLELRSLGGLVLRGRRLGQRLTGLVVEPPLAEGEPGSNGAVEHHEREPSN